MNNVMEKKKTVITSSRASIIQDTLLSCLGSFLAFLLVRWLSEPIYGFTLHFFIYVGCALVFTLLGQFLSGSFRNLSPGLSYWARDRILLTVLIKEACLALVMFLDKDGFAQPTLIILAIVADTLFSITMILYARSFVSHIREEDKAIKELSERLNALVFGDDEAAARFADEAVKSGRYNLLGLISRQPEMDRKVLGDYLIYYVPDNNALDALQWRLGGIDCILFPKGGSEGDTAAGEEDEAGAQGGPASSQGRMSAFGRFVKRSFDVLLSSVLLIVFLPLIILCALAVLIEDGSPVIYSQERIGKGGKPFRILKFRSMRRDAEAMGVPRLYSGENDPRLTKVGKFIRQHHLDELPQLWNVLRGDMSFIGYRPERQFYIDRIMEKNPRYRYLYQIRPGVTSYATLYNGYTDTLEKMLTRLDLDLYYLRNHSVWFDVRVLGLTFLRIVGGKKF